MQRAERRTHSSTNSPTQARPIADDRWTDAAVPPWMIEPPDADPERPSLQLPLPEPLPCEPEEAPKATGGRVVIFDI